MPDRFFFLIIFLKDTKKQLMHRSLLFFTSLALLVAALTANAEPANDRKQQYAAIGNFPLENGQEIIDCKVGYRTFGTLNATRSNAVIYPSAGGMTTFMMQLFGAGSEVDTTRFYLVLVDAFGNGVSSSPSNSKDQPGASFPQFSISDMVNAQYKMLTGQMNIHHIAAVVGGSMGGLQALQWAVSYPTFMDKVVAIEGTPKLSTYDMLWMTTYTEAIKNDTAYHGGNYTVAPQLQLATHLAQLVLTTPGNVNKMVPADSLFLLFAMLEKNPFKVDANNILWQTNAVMKHNITVKAGGSLENAARMIKAKVLIIANKQDHNIDQTLSIRFAGIAKAELVVMDSELGHLVFSDKSVTAATSKFLSQ